MTATEELRAAAKLMRERATAATPGPWSVRTVPPAWSGFDKLPEAHMVIAGGQNVAGVDSHATAAYIASIHPGVALAIADWLARFADPVYCYGPVEYDAALAVARAYLGTTSGEVSR